MERAGRRALPAGRSDDIEAVLAHGTVDVDRVRGWLIALVGAEDDRLVRLTEAQRRGKRQDPPTFSTLLRPRGGPHAG